MEVCINECAVVLDTRWEQINWLDDITYIVHLVQGNWIMKRADWGQTRQLAGQWTGQTRAGCWMTSPSTRSVNGLGGLDGK